MTLSEYLDINKISVANFACQIGARSRATVYRYMKGIRFPRPHEMQKIKTATNGAVTYESFPAPNRKNNRKRKQ